MGSKIFSGHYKNLAKISDYVAKYALDAGLDEQEVYNVQLAVDEACTNIIEHSYGGEGVGEIVCTCNLFSGGIEIVLEDEGIHFDPDLIPEPDITLPIEEVTPRGAGVFLMNKVMDEVNYEFKNGAGTILRMKKIKKK